MLSLNLSKVFPETNNLVKSVPINSQNYRKPNIPRCLSKPASPIPLSCRATAPTYAAVIEEERVVIQIPEELRPEVMPKHIAVILDGNGRWAKNRGLQVQDGHQAAMVTLKSLASNCCELGIKVLTVYAFSTENWNRSEAEVGFLMRCIENFIRSDVTDLLKRHNIRFSVIGDKSRLPQSLQSAILFAEEVSHANKGMHFLMAVNYGGRREIVETCQKIAWKVEDGVLRVEDIDESVLDREMMTNVADFPNPDLIIRTSGELRMSNFLLWQLAYAEFYFPSKFFPDFGKDDLIEALISFQRRKRRFGERPN